jgi:group I intron endonuclease
MQNYINLNNKFVQKRILRDNRNKIGIYMLINLTNDKTYIGSSSNLSSRLFKYFNKKSLNNKKMLINLAILKHGLKKFSLKILEYCPAEIVFVREQYYVNMYSPEYNIYKKVRPYKISILTKKGKN